MEGQTPKFGVVMMFEKTNPEHKKFLNDLHADLNACLVEAWPDTAKRPRIPLIGETKSPIKDGDTTLDSQGIPLCEKNEEYAGHFIVRASSTRKPITVDRGMAEILDSNEIYGGCFCKVNMNVYSFDMATNKGLTFGVNGVQKWDDGESFGGGRPDVDSMFTAETGQDDPANYESADPLAGAGASDANPF